MHLSCCLQLTSGRVCAAVLVNCGSRPCNAKSFVLLSQPVRGLCGVTPPSKESHKAVASGLIKSRETES